MAHRQLKRPTQALAVFALIAVAACTSQPQTPQVSGATEPVVSVTDVVVRVEGQPATTVPVRQSATASPIATASGVDAPAATALPGAPLDATATTVQTPGAVVHIVQRGETLALIAGEYAVSVQNLATLNEIRNPNLIHPGQELVIGTAHGDLPVSSAHTMSHIVQSGDTLRSIAEIYEVSIQNLIALNAVSDPDAIWVGQTLVVGPAVTPTTTPTPTPRRTLTMTPSPTETEAPREPLSSEEISYVRQAGALALDYTDASEDLMSLMDGALKDSSHLSRDDWTLEVAVALGRLELDRKSLHNLRVPRRFADVHLSLTAASRLIDKAAGLIPAPLEKLRPDRIQEIHVTLDQGREALAWAAGEAEELRADLAQ
jgi:LysM repeat protein